MSILTSDECKRIRLALIFGDPSQEGYPDPKLEVAKAKLLEIEKGQDPELGGRRWGLWLGDDNELRADAIAPEWGGGGYVVVPEDPTVTPPWEHEV